MPDFFCQQGEATRFTKSMNEILGSSRYSFKTDNNATMELDINSATHGKYSVSLSRHAMWYKQKVKSLKGYHEVDRECMGFRVSIYIDGDELIQADCTDIPTLIGAIMSTICTEVCSSIDMTEAQEAAIKDSKAAEKWKREHPEQWDEYLDSGKGRERPCMSRYL